MPIDAVSRAHALPTLGVGPLVTPPVAPVLPEAPVSAELIAAVLARKPAVAASAPHAILGTELCTPRELAERVHLGQEITIAPTSYESPEGVAKKIAAVVGGTPESIVPNQKARLVADDGATWIVELDGKVPGGAPILEIGSPPTIGASDAGVLALLPVLHAIGEPVASLGGGHIHIDGGVFLAKPAVLARFLELYFAMEPAILAAFRHPARAHAARGLTEREDPSKLRAELSSLSSATAESLPGALAEILARHKIGRNHALNLLSLVGIFSGNKKSKGTIELRLFDTPRDLEQARTQRELVRALLAATFSSRPIPADLGAMGLDTELVERLRAMVRPKLATPARVPIGPWSV